MKIKLTKDQWLKIGEEKGYIKSSQFNQTSSGMIDLGDMIAGPTSSILSSVRSIEQKMSSVMNKIRSSIGRIGLESKVGMRKQDYNRIMNLNNAIAGMDGWDGFFRGSEVDRIMQSKGQAQYRPLAVNQSNQGNTSQNTSQNNIIR